MRKALLTALFIAASSVMVAAQNGKIVFGPLEGDSAGAILLENGQSFAIPVWVRTTPGTNIVGLHWPLSSKNAYIASRNGINYDYDPFVGQNPGDSSWQAVIVLAPNPLGDYTNQGLLAIKDFPRNPYQNDGIQTEGEWWQVAEYYLTATSSNPTDTLLCDAFQAGYQPDNGGFVWSDFSRGELPANTFEYSYSCISFSSNIDPVWCPTEPEYCGDAGAPLCIQICGFDSNLMDNLRITQTAGGGQFTEEVGGPGGHASGTWCGTLSEGPHTISFELNDNVGGVVPLDLNVLIKPVTMDISCVNGFAGGTAYIPVIVKTCEFRIGGMEILAGWDSTALTLINVVPSNRIDNGKEYWNVNHEIPCQNCPNIDGARIIWVSDIDNGFPHSPAYPGEEPIFHMVFKIADDQQVGNSIPVTFYTNNNNDNTLSDSAGVNWFRPSLDDGCVDIVDGANYKGDPNVNGIFYEIGDAMLIVRYFIHGNEVWAENGIADDAIQESSADLNNNSIVDVADLVRFFCIINGIVAPPKFDPALATAEIGAIIADNEMQININSGTDVGGVLLALDHPGIMLGIPDAGGMDVMSDDAGGTMRVVVYSLQSGSIPSGQSRLLTIPIISNNNGSVRITEISAADSYGRPIEINADVVAPVPVEYALLSNYPNPFNARTTISYALPKESHVTIEIYDLLGRIVAALVDDIMPAGYHSVIWDSSEQSSGMYFYKIKTDNFTDTKKMLLLK